MLLKGLRPTINVIKCTTSGVRSFKTDCCKIESTLSVLSLNATPNTTRNSTFKDTNNVKFTPWSITLNAVKHNILDAPVIKPNVIPNYNKIIIEDILPIIRDVNCPSNGQIVEKKAHRMIIQRRRKMKKHQLKKWRKKYKFDIRKRKLRRQIKREKEFQALLLSNIKIAEQFNAEDYVKDKLKRASEIPKFVPYRRPPITSNIIFHPGIPDETATKK